MVIVILLILVAGVFLFIKPNIETIAETKATLDDKKEEYNSDEAKAATKDDLKKQILTAYDEGKNMADMFFPDLTTYQADDELRAFLDTCESNILVEDVTIDQPQAVILSANMYEHNEITYALKEYVNQGVTSNIEETDPGYARQVLIQKYLGTPQTIGSISIEFTAKAIEKEDLLKFADEINNYQKQENGKAIRKAMALDSLSFTDNLVKREYETKARSLLEEAEVSASTIFKEKTKKELSGGKTESEIDTPESDESEAGNLSEYFYGMPCKITFYSIERMQDPTQRLNEQDGTAAATTSGTESNATSAAASDASAS